MFYQSVVHIIEYSQKWHLKCVLIVLRFEQFSDSFQYKALTSWNKILNANAPSMGKKLVVNTTSFNPKVYRERGDKRLFVEQSKTSMVLIKRYW